MTVSASRGAAAGSEVPPPAQPVGRSPSGRQRTWWWAARLIALLAVAITVMIIALAIGMRANDNAIDEHRGTATATVLSVSPLRTGIEFVDINGSTIRPDGGVLYPGLLSVGQQFVVEYSTVDPQIARVAGRTASVGNWMLLLTAAVTYLIAGALVWWCLRRAQLPLVARRRGPGHAGGSAAHA
jgi:hypothetical protein